MVSKKPELKDTSPIKSVLSLPNTKTNQKPSKIIITKKQIIKSSPIPVDNTENDSDKSQNLTNFKPLRFRADPLSFIIKGTTELSAFYSGAGWRAYEEYIGTKILYPEYTLSIKKALLGSDRVKSAINKLLEEAPEKERQKKKHILWRETESIANKMIGFDILVKMYHQGIHIQEREYLRLKNVALYAQENNLSMIFLPCHKSHIDYLVISYIFFRLGLALPHIAAGENLNMPVVGNILKKNGAFFIRRQWGNDAIYLALMKEYLELLLERGHNIEAFIEGTRSRMGKLLQPKFGILKIILDSVLAEKRIKDCIIVPMSIGYDKVIEASGYINELLGTPKEKESLLQLLSNFNILSLKWGRIDVRFAEPFSLKDYIHSQIERRGPSFQPSSSPADKDLLLQSLGFRVLGDINEVSVVMPTALVGTVLLTLRGRGVGRDELIRKVNWLKREILKKNGRVADFGTMSTGEIVDRAIPVLKDLISVRSDLLEPVFYPNKRFELSLYRNQVIHLFISESVLSTALYATIKAGGPHQSQKIKYQKLCDDIGFLSSLLKYEFIFQFGGLEEVTSKTLDELVKRYSMLS
ncbi:hypothetical protein HK099_008309 [Clydaea vesicula]|uniref:Phospholipid/glycerol acyltransferase domain-containing protein n=1 Tax=Clydaea vesicula TaxID=447962 RepID=A0AAD5XZH3_9FUNG|nr:hypothetical protein HK099_008309 [Clydaea vesicula]